MKSKLLLILSCFMLIAAPLFAANNNNPTKALDGKTFAGTLTMKGDKPDSDNFVFKNGKFRSTACDQYGYGEGDYRLSQNKDAWKFTALTSNKEGNKMTWTGTVNGNSVKGTAVMLSKAGDMKNFSFEGTLK